jgi:mannose-1-phosphate guanylyltransferase
MGRDSRRRRRDSAQIFDAYRIHEPYYQPILCREPGANLVVQPRNIGTAPAILYSLLKIAAVEPDAIVALFPSDHYISDNSKFMTYVRMALDTARQDPELVILLGVEPESPEVEYGWIELGAPMQPHPRIFGVRRFWEKPHKMLAQVLQLRGCLWNSFVMIGTVQALLDSIQCAIPELYRAFSCLVPLFGTAAEEAAIEHLYKRQQEVNFSHQVLAQQPGRLAVLRITGVRWNDLGEPQRVMVSLKMAGARPQWAIAELPQVT